MTKGVVLSSQAYDIMKNEIAGKEEQLVALHSAAARHGRAALADGDGGTRPTALRRWSASGAKPRSGKLPEPPLSSSASPQDSNRF